jgi:hypothetical protein
MHRPIPLLRIHPNRNSPLSPNLPSATNPPTKLKPTNPLPLTSPTPISPSPHHIHHHNPPISHMDTEDSTPWIPMAKSLTLADLKLLQERWK